MVETVLTRASLMAWSADILLFFHDAAYAVLYWICLAYISIQLMVICIWDKVCLKWTSCKEKWELCHKVPHLSVWDRE